MKVHFGGVCRNAREAVMASEVAAGQRGFRRIEPMGLSEGRAVYTGGTGLPHNTQP